MKNSENLRLIAKLRKIYREICKYLLKLLKPQNIYTNQVDEQIIGTTNAANRRPTTAKETSKMSSEHLGGIAVAFGLLAAIAGVLSASSAVIAWKAATKEAKASSDALDKYKADSTERVKTLEGETATANQRAAEANLQATALRRALGDRFITPEESSAFMLAAKQADKPALIRVVPEDFGDGDADEYSRQIMDMLQKAGYKCERILPGEWDRITGSWDRYSSGRREAFPWIRLEFINAGQWVWQLNKLFPSVLGVYINPGSPRFPGLTPQDGGILIVGRKPDVRIPPP